MKNGIKGLLLTGVAAFFAFGTAQAAEQHNHSGHSHGGHSHSGHQHDTHAHKEQAQQKAAENQKHAHQEALPQKKVSQAEHHHSGHGHDHTASDSPYYGHLDIKVHADSVLKAGEPDEEINEIYAHSHLELGARLGEGFSLNTNILLEGGAQWS